MRYLMLLFFVFLVSGCTGIGGYKFYALEKSEEYIDCALLLKDPRIGGLWQLSGKGNSRTVSSNGQDLLVCSKTMSEESLYLVGPFVPIIPLFGIFSNEQPKTPEFVFINRSDKNTSKLNLRHGFNWCISSYPKASSKSCKRSKFGTEVTIPPNSILHLDTKFQEQIEFILEGPGAHKETIKFDYDSGVYFIFTG
ncbi:hypothetical protein [Pseudoalteromonas luteoviolacea]|uniref:hypothetical protein n=1 Tax=Pseudoalteromonas luteoviolacea TaxID=43657 RepID=UPI000A96E61F|nr:hypothetical protein [Pseudoalteromonas luteoviolacea]